MKTCILFFIYLTALSSIHGRPLTTDLARTMINSGGTDQSSGEIINSGRIMLQDFGYECTSDSECYEGTVCVNSSDRQACGYDKGGSCSNDDECGGGYVCNDQKICGDNYNYECSGNGQCTDNLICSSGACSDNFGVECQGASDCTDPLSCINSSDRQACGYDKGGSCSNDDECGGGYVCNNQICIDNYNYECSGNGQCTDNLICSGGTCSDNYGEPCNVELDCSGSLVCPSGQCETAPSETVVASPLPIASPSPLPVQLPSPSPSPVAVLQKPPPRPQPASSEAASSTSGSLSGSAVPETTSSSSGLSTGAIIGIAVGGAVLLLILVVLALSCRTMRPPFRKSNIPWPPREFTDPRIQPEYMRFWYGPMHDKSQEVHRRWHPFLDTHGRDIAPPECQPKELPGVYEFGLVHASCRRCAPVVVYVGKAGGEKGLRSRHQTYANTNGDHAHKHFEHAQRHGCLIYRRFVYDTVHAGGHHGAGDRAVTQMETRFLSFFDYAFNTVGNEQSRSIYLKPRKWLCCIPAGIYIMNDKAEAPFPRQLPPKMPCFC